LREESLLDNFKTYYQEEYLGETSIEDNDSDLKPDINLEKINNKDGKKETDAEFYSRILDMVSVLTGVVSDRLIDEQIKSSTKEGTTLFTDRENTTTIKTFSTSRLFKNRFVRNIYRHLLRKDQIDLTKQEKITSISSDGTTDDASNLDEIGIILKSLGNIKKKINLIIHQNSSSRL